MSHTLVLCEKPSIAKLIAEALIPNYIKRKGYFEGNNLLVTWCVGHLLDLAEPEHYNPRFKQWNLSTLPIIPATYEIIEKQETRVQLEVIKKLVSKCTAFINAADAGREEEYLQLKKEQESKELLTNGITSE